MQQESIALRCVIIAELIENIMPINYKKCASDHEKESCKSLVNKFFAYYTHNECQDVRSGRRKTKSKRTHQPFVLKGMLKCQHCACSYSPELKKGRYVYMRPTKSKGECSYCYHINENAVLSQIEDVLKGMKIPQHILNDVANELKKSSDKEHQHQVSEGVIPIPIFN